MRKNLALIGMAGVGKSTTGKSLAEQLGYDCIECDSLMTIEAQKRGVNKFLLSDADFIALEGDVICSLANAERTVIDTGGSAVYSADAMRLLKTIATTVYLKDSIEDIKQRFIARGQPHVVGIGARTFEELFLERNCLYEQYADIVVDISTHPALAHTVQEIVDALGQN
ncbi:hypothetical protein CCAX7_31330 [Capsulimonas corticalis]|uniref:Shikimate kinase n=1 Tax=Capsulimonas corticalis TaxID=2219043 RepID=A0A402CSH5_9BACT|nr:shikimate kinase [Capsulimonas corticalis]BDI31082.1 hypothetical protein CCAX7_31330 [Capsulimonas corticalis]